MAIVSDKTRQILGSAQAKLSELRVEKADTVSDFDKAIKDAQYKLTIAKMAKPQDIENVKALQDELDSLSASKDKYLKEWDNRYTEASKGKNEAAGNVRAEKQAITKDMTEKTWNGVKDSAKAGYEATKNEVKDREGLSPSFYRDIAATFSGKLPGNRFNDYAAASKAQAKNQKEEAANRQMEAQASQQIADRNEYTEAGKVASMKNDALNRQNIANKEGMSGAAAALTRQTTAPDIAAERSRQDQQRSVANERRQEADTAQQGATESMGNVAMYQHTADQFDQKYDTQQKLAKAAGTKDTEENKNKGTEGTENTENENENTETESTENNNPNPMEQKPETTVPEHSGNDASVPETEPEPEAQKEPEPPDPSRTDLINRIKAWVEKVKAKYPESSIERTNAYESAVLDNESLENIAKDAKMSSGKFEAWRAWGKSLLNTTSDCRTKNIIKELSDCRMKWIREDFDNYGRPSENDFLFLLKQVGSKLNLDGQEYDLNGNDYSDNDTVLKGYADNIRNYVYNYKPEAMEISSDNDPSVTHIGPMAQDIEKVNPACISKDENGIESVDTGRLAMMNSGAIGDLARSLDEIKARLTRLEAQNGNA